VKLGADPRSVQMDYENSTGISLDPQGNLLVAVAGAKIIGSKPVIYQEIGGRKRYVDGGYVLNGDNRAGFRIGRYDPAETLIIDPTTSTYGTYVGPPFTGDFSSEINAVTNG